MGNSNEEKKEEVSKLVNEFIDLFAPIETNLNEILVFVDHRTGAHYFESHIKASKFIESSTTDVPLDPDEQGEYRANREIVNDHVAFERMKSDASQRRSFSNIVAEFNPQQNPSSPLGVIGGQHRTEAIKEALAQGIDEFHEVKVYFALDQEQRLDVQVVSNTVIAVSGDLYDRMLETVKGPELRKWCHQTGLLAKESDFGDKAQRSGPITVRLARTFIINFYEGVKHSRQPFDTTDTSPIIPSVGIDGVEWDKLRSHKPSIWEDSRLSRAGMQFAKLVAAQRKAIESRKGPADYREKAMNIAILAAWAYVAGFLTDNEARLKRHFALSEKTSGDPLNSAALAKGRHKTDPENYRGLGTRTDAKERGRLVELFYYQAEKGDGITKSAIEVAIAKYYAKQSQLEVQRLEKGAK
ncbi:hypothetical protein H7849_16635 [Alloacidobacterium dinghuense]|uniref:Uncharacterized protein n=1 Tax=Alloacidobacterium dinghuense TaxID=2763107 RepID=A0A7G8BR66_9BACT|nr:hypothetical protein H7849_16635 [Alloacidobacterium dinghuense]